MKKDDPNSGASLSRRDVVKLSTLASIGALASAGGSAATSAAAALAARPKLTPHRAATQIAKHLGGQEVALLRNKQSRAFELDHYLAHRDAGAATVAILEEMKPPHLARATSRKQPRSVPPDRVSTAKNWWGYEIRFPHQIVVKITTTIIGTNDEVDAVKDLIFAGIEDLEVLEPFLNAITVYVLSEWSVLNAIDGRTGNGAAIKATWLAPLIFVPTKI